MHAKFGWVFSYFIRTADVQSCCVFRYFMGCERSGRLSSTRNRFQLSTNLENMQFYGKKGNE